MSKRKTTEEFILDAIKIHGDRYDYSLVSYINNYVKIKIKCIKHGYFQQTPKNHLNKKQGCPDCSGNRKKTTNTFIIDGNNKHNNKYNYDKSHYISNKVNVIITCKEHGDFQQTPDGHLNQKQGCPDCAGNRRKNTIKFIKEASILHNNSYDYSLVEYINNDTNVEIICKKHGSFKQLPTNHINGRKGCPKCKSSKGELSILKFLENNNINYTEQKKFQCCKFKRKLAFDFHLPDYNICIEYDGKQHFEPIEYFGGLYKFNDLKKRDNIKNNYCEKNNIKLLRIPYWNFNNIDDILIQSLKM